MATIITFSSARLARPVEAQRPECTAKIVFFPGVRHSRAPEAEPFPAKASAERERDFLSIPD